MVEHYFLKYNHREYKNHTPTHPHHQWCFIVLCCLSLAAKIMPGLKNAKMDDVDYLLRCYKWNCQKICIVQ